MATFKRFNGKRITSRHPKYDKATWYCFFRIDGKAYHRSLNARTQVQADKAERELIDKIINGASDEQGFTDFVEDVYRRYIEGLSSKYTIELLLPILQAFFKNKLLNKIKPQDCRDYRNLRAKTPTKTGRRSDGSLNREMAILSKIFSLAIEEGCAKENPVSKVKKLTENKPRHRILRPEQWNALFRELDKDQLVKDLVTIAMNFPLRKTQIVSIQRKDVDLQNRTLTVIESKRKPPRVLFINDAVFETLERLSLSHRDDLFPVKRFEKRWRQILKNAKINEEKGERKDNFHFHDLRTYLGTSMIKDGVSPRVVQKVFDHSNMTTSAIYMAVDFEQQKEALQSAGATFSATNFIDETAHTQ
jgi:integrase